MNIFITGVSSGLGKGLAEVYLENRSIVFGLSRRVPEELCGISDFYFQKCDLEKLQDIPERLSLLTSGHSGFDLVILNAGILGDVSDMRYVSVEKMKQVMDINLWSNKVIIDYLFKMKKKPQQVVAISSGASVSGQRGWAGYGVSKAALNMLIKLYAAEIKDTHFISLAPGLIDTPMQEYISTVPDADKFEVIERLRSARGSDDMPQSYEAAKKIYNAIPGLIQYPSGSYLDIRKI